MLRRALLLLAALAAPAHGLAKGGGFATKAKPKKEKKPKAAAPPPPLPAGMGDVAVERTSVVADGAPAPQFVGSFLMADEGVVDGVCAAMYVEDYPYAGAYGPWSLTSRTNIQLYPPSGGYKTYHTERTGKGEPEGRGTSSS
ncbi:hypothetical protein SO694_00016240 [Aureococcus anophagefferens]|uniref:Uncharacterized protein n=1 Tax=Aureococcus anophagefferens TaxID=44056 RepID=A0ABR1G1Y1_AURAN